MILDSPRSNILRGFISSMWIALWGRISKYKWNGGERKEREKIRDVERTIASRRFPRGHRPGECEKKRGRRGRKGSFATKNSTAAPNGRPPVPVCYPFHLLKSADFSSLSSLSDTSETVSRSSSVFFLLLFDLYLLLASPPFRGGTFVKEGLPLFREPTPPLIFRDDRSVPAFLIVHHCFQWILLFQVALFMELREDLSRRLEWHELIFADNCK